MMQPFANGGKTLHYRYAHALSQTPGLVHGSFTRLGGVGTGYFRGSNFRLHDSGDDPENIRENYRLAGEELGFDPARLAGGEQIHRTRIKFVRRTDAGLLWREPQMRFDGMVTNQVNLPLAVFHADCAPIFLYDPVKRAIGLAHCGWRGLVRRIGDPFVRAMWERFGSKPENIIAAVGPHLHGDCFECTRTAAQPILREYGMAAENTIRLTDDKHFIIDLSPLYEQMLIDAGIAPEHITVDTACTNCDPHTFWSHRAMTAMGRPRGNMMSVIMLRPLEKDEKKKKRTSARKERSAS